MKKCSKLKIFSLIPVLSLLSITSIFVGHYSSSTSLDNIVDTEAASTTTVDFSSDPIYSSTQIQNYYSTVNLDAKGNTLKNALYSLIHPKKCSSGYKAIWDYLPSSDADPDNTTSGKIIAFYRGTAGDKSAMNKEHVWPDSRGGNYIEGDPHMVRPTFTADNSSRGNSFYGTSAYDPGEFGAYQYRGIAARIIFYCAVQEKDKLNLVDKNTDSASNHTMGKLSDLLQWNLDYPIDDTETLRNDVLSGFRSVKNSNYKFNRNPFIDDRTLPCKIWGDTNEDTKRICSSVLNSIEPTQINITNSETSLVVDSTLQINFSVVPVNASKTVTYTSSDPTILSVSTSGLVTAHKKGNATVTVKCATNNQVYDTIDFDVLELNSISLSGTPNIVKYNLGDNFNPNGLTVTGSFSDGSKKVINNSSCEWLDGVTLSKSLSLGTTSIVCRYGGCTATYEGITVEQMNNSTTTINISSFTLSSSYAWQSWTSDGIKGYGYLYGGNKNAIQTSSSKDSCYIFNETAFGGAIRSITVTSSKDSPKFTLYTNSSQYSKANGYPTNGNKQGEKTVTTSGVTWDIDGSDKYFALVNTNSGAAYLSSIVIAYGGGTTPSVDSIKLATKTLSLNEGEDFHLEMTASGPVTLTSSDPTVATISTTGVISALKEGKTTITAKVGTATDTCEVTVKKVEIQTDSVELDINTAEMFVGDELQLNATGNGPISYESSDTEIATISSSGLVSALDVGVVTITAKVGTATDTCTITIKEVPINDYVNLTYSSILMKVGEKYNLNAISNTTVEFYSPQEGDIISVSQNGEITALKEGEATIIVTAGQANASCQVVVEGNTSPTSNGCSGNVSSISIFLPLFTILGIIFVLFRKKKNR